MKKLIVLLAAMAMLSTTGCANGPVRNFLRNTICHKGCEAPPADPSYGFDMGSASSGCASGNCGQLGQGQIINGPVISGVDSNQGYSAGYAPSDPYMNGSNYGGATINPPVFDQYSNPSYGSTIVPPGSSGTLPTPLNGS